MRHGLAILGWIGAGCTAAACTAWPVGAPLDPATSGLIGDWARRDETGHADTVVWRFRPDGTAERFQLRALPAATPAQWQRVAVIRWEVRKNKGGDPRPAVCLSYGGRPPRWPSCRLFTISTVADTGGRALRRLSWEGWLGERSMSTQVFWERRP